MSAVKNSRLLIGKINGLFGIKGWVKIFSYCDPIEQIITYNSWLLKTNKTYTNIKVLGGRKQGKTVVAELAGISTTELAQQYIGQEIYINKSQLAQQQDEYYYYQLEGLAVKNIQNIDLGIVEYLFNNGSNTVLATKSQMIPFISPYLIAVDLEKGEIVVDWDINF